MNLLRRISFMAVTALLSSMVTAQEEDNIRKEVELGGLFTSGNTEEASLNFAGAIIIDSDQWQYNFSLDGLFASSEGEVKGQRFYGIASANYEFSDDSFFLTRFSHEDDRFSGFDSQSDLTFNYGRGLLKNRADMGLTLNAGLGVRWSRLDGSDFDEPIFRTSGDYNWIVSGSAVFNQELSSEVGTDSNIYRSETSIETEILENLTLKFSLNIKHQTDVPVGREKTDTQTAVTFVMNF